MNTKLIFSLMLSLGLNLVAAGAWAGSWKEITATEQETVSIDHASIQIDGDEIQVKVLRDYADTQLNLLDGRWHAFRSQVALYAVDCDEGKLGHIEWSLHKAGQGRGRVIHAGKVGGVSQVDAPVSAGDRALMFAVCTSTVVLAHRTPQVLAEVRN